MEDEIYMKKRDMIIIAAVVIVAAALFAAGWFITHQGPEDYVNIYVGNTLYESDLLNEDKVVEIKQGDYENHIEIKDGVVRMKDSNCSNQDCVGMGSMSAEDQGIMFGIIVCLPHQVTIELRLASEEQG